MLMSTGAVALLLGFLFYATTFYIPIVQEPKLEYQRQPASQSYREKFANPSKIEERTMISLELKCLEEHPKLYFTGVARMAQVKGKLCKENSINTVEVINRTNGIEALVFNKSSNYFLTDYFSLAPGKNQILVKITTNTSSWLSQLTVESQAPLIK